MVGVQLDPVREERLRELAKSRGQDASSFVKTLLEDYLDLEALPEDSEEAWADASVRLASEVLDEEAWDEGDGHGSR